jgi:hypothetical protein
MSGKENDSRSHCGVRLRLKNNNGCPDRTGKPGQKVIRKAKGSLCTEKEREAAPDGPLHGDVQQGISAGSL